MKHRVALAVCRLAAVLVAPLAACGEDMVPDGTSPPGEVPGALRFAALADARVEADHPDTNFGAERTILAGTSPMAESYLRFAVRGVTAPVRRATLRLTRVDAAGPPPRLAKASTAWNEATVTWLARPALGAVLAEGTMVDDGDQVVYDVTSAVRRDGGYAFALIPADGERLAAASRESGAAPELVIELDDAHCLEGDCAVDGDHGGGDGDGYAGDPPGQVFAFSSVGDQGASADTAAVLELAPSQGDLFLALGDLSYGEIAPERAWCDFVRERVGPGYPVAIVSGNHEAHSRHGDGLIENFIADDCLPNPLPNAVGEYGKQYYVDLPADAPIVRVILYSANLDFEFGGAYRYDDGTARQAWLGATIDQARAAGIPWVIAANHNNCITTGIKGCEMGADVFDFLVAKKVDLILQGHDHTYQRSKQLAHGDGCAAIAPGVYDPDCVVDDGADGAYERGAGPVLVINGMGGVSSYGITPGDSEAGYFAAATSDETYGLITISGTAEQLDVAFVPASGAYYADSFSIGQSSR